MSVLPKHIVAATIAVTCAAAVLLGQSALAAAEQASNNAPSPPNIVFILVDDMGWTDVACFGSDFYETPNIDRLAEGGMKLTDAYAACPVCSPTRASIMTGKYPARMNLTNFLVGRRQKPGSPVLTAPFEHHMGLDEVTVAEALHSAGYATCHAGKWHLGGKPYYPQHQGFDVNIAGTSAGMPRSFFYPQWKANVPLDGKPGDYLPDRLTDESLRFIEEHQETPFFLYLSFYAVHIPIEGKEELVEKYQAKRPGKNHDNPRYAAMVEAVDANVGRVMDKLDALDLAEDTLVIFFSDNGGLSVREGKHTPATSNAPLRAGKGYIYEGGIREPCIVRWPGKVPAGSKSDVPVSSIDFYPTLLAAAGVDPPADHVVDGVSLLPLLTGKGELPPRALFWHYPHFSNQGGMPAAAIREGDYKLIEFYEHGDLELYNLHEDIGEQNNLANEMPDRVRSMHARLKAWRQQVDANMPPKNPKYQPQD